jgi:hypothetical protein
VTRADEVVEPTERGGYGIKLAGDWYQAQLKEPPSTTDPSHLSDVHVVQAKILPRRFWYITDPAHRCTDFPLWAARRQAQARW